MSKNHNKSEFNKIEPKPTCNTCGVSEPFVLLRSQLTEVPGDRAQNMNAGYFEGIGKLHHALLENLYGKIDQGAEQFHSTLENWLRSAPKETDNSPWLEGYYHWVGDVRGFCNSVVWGALEIHQAGLLEARMEANPELFRKADENAKDHSNFLKARVAPQIAYRLSQSLERNEANPLSGLKFHHHELIGTTRINSKSPHLTTLLNDSLKGVRHEIESSLKRFGSTDSSWLQRRLKNDPRYGYLRPRHWAQSIPRGAYYSGIQVCGACGSEQNRSINIKFEGNTCTHVYPNQPQKASNPLEYDGPVNELLIRIKPKLDEIWGEAIEELELRIEACNKLLKDAEKQHKHRLELQRKKEKQAEISALEGRLKELKNED